MPSGKRLRNYSLVLFAQLILLFLAALMHLHVALYIIFILFFLFLFGSIIVAIGPSKKLRMLALISAAIAIVSGLLWLFPDTPQFIVHWCLFVTSLASAMFILIAILSMSHNVFLTDRITSNLIVGSICVYMLIGMFFSFVYASEALFIPESILVNDVPIIHTAKGFNEFLYFSYTTLTTLGYGDIVPTMPIARLTAMLEAMIGPVYLAIMVARLVGMHITQAHSKPSN